MYFREFDESALIVNVRATMVPMCGDVCATVFRWIKLMVRCAALLLCQTMILPGDVVRWCNNGYRRCVCIETMMVSGIIPVATVII